jgi:RHS repeat-associated protein
MTVRDPTTWAEVAWGNSKKNEVLYCGYRFDPETGLFHVRQRYYDPPLGRWVSRDLIQYADGMNLYQYCLGGPLSLHDPAGLAVTGEAKEPVVTVYDDTASWKKLGYRDGTAGMTGGEMSVKAGGVYDPSSPCCCTFTLAHFDIQLRSDIANVGVIYGHTSGILRLPLTVDAVEFHAVNVHEGLHRDHMTALWQRYRAQLSASGKCCYYRGVLIFARGRPQSQELCERRADRLGRYVLGQLKKYVREVGRDFDAFVGPSSSLEVLKAADERAKKKIAAMKMRDWNCDDTASGWETFGAGP